MSSRSGWVAGLVTIVVVSCIPLAAGAEPRVWPRGGLLSRNFVVSTRAVNQYFPQITEQSATGRDETAQGRPIKTRAVFFTNGHSLKVTITVDKYLRPRDAASAYEQAVEQSELVPGFEPIAVPPVGERSFAGSVTQDGETHIGLGALDGCLVIGVTLAGFHVTPENVANLVGLARAQDAAAYAALACGCE